MIPISRASKDVLIIKSPLIRTTSFFFFSSRRRHTRWNCDWSFRRVLFRSSATHSRTPQILPLGKGFLVSWIEEGDGPKGSGGGGAEAGLRLAQLDEKGVIVGAPQRSEERRVGKECRSRWSPEQEEGKDDDS